MSAESRHSTCSFRQWPHFQSSSRFHHHRLSHHQLSTSYHQHHYHQQHHLHQHQLQQQQHHYPHTSRTPSRHSFRIQKPSIPSSSLPPNYTLAALSKICSNLHDYYRLFFTYNSTTHPHSSFPCPKPASSLCQQHQDRPPTSSPSHPSLKTTGSSSSLQHSHSPSSHGPAGSSSTEPSFVQLNSLSHASFSLHSCQTLNPLQPPPPPPPPLLNPTISSPALSTASVPLSTSSSTPSILRSPSSQNLSPNSSLSMHHLSPHSSPTQLLPLSHLHAASAAYSYYSPAPPSQKSTPTAYLTSIAPFHHHPSHPAKSLTTDSASVPLNSVINPHLTDYYSCSSNTSIRCPVTSSHTTHPSHPPTSDTVATPTLTDPSVSYHAHTPSVPVKAQHNARPAASPRHPFHRSFPYFSHTASPSYHTSPSTYARHDAFAVSSSSSHLTFQHTLQSSNSSCSSSSSSLSFHPVNFNPSVNSTSYLSQSTNQPICYPSLQTRSMQTHASHEHFKNGATSIYSSSISASITSRDQPTQRITRPEYHPKSELPVEQIDSHYISKSAPEVEILSVQDVTEQASPVSNVVYCTRVSTPSQASVADKADLDRRNHDNDPQHGTLIINVREKDIVNNEVTSNIEATVHTSIPSSSSTNSQASSTPVSTLNTDELVGLGLYEPVDPSGITVTRTLKLAETWHPPEGGDDGSDCDTIYHSERDEGGPDDVNSAGRNHLSARNFHANDVVVLFGSC